MNDTEIKDIDKLKNLLIEFGVDASFVEYEDGTSLVSIEGTTVDCDFWFSSDGMFEEVIME